MTKNMGNADRALRIIAAIAIIALYYGGMLSGWLTTVLLIVAVGLNV